ncbi:SpoIIE family protein phosphatase [Streptomyces sp. PLK6-54]|uniref:SpoIIE family protein phosphatase n=1 Tax=Actinacidiphila acidipaludis TaxID=2873382 RepID=A0ABS7QAB9_9ACTN|nr:SpoIIE family protein phosphatase [Streptomyces acidipaludis]
MLLGDVPQDRPDALRSRAPWLATAHLGLADGPRPPAPSAPSTSGPSGPSGAEPWGDGVRGLLDGRSLEGRPVPGTDGSVTWWLLDDSDRQRAERELARERERTAFLAEASSRLLASLNVERCMDVTVLEAVRRLADAAVVIGPNPGRRLRLVSCVRGGSPAAATTTQSPDMVPGLSEALQGFPPVPSRWINPAAAPAWLVPEGFGPVGSMAVVPLPGQGVPAGALVLLRHEDGAAFDENEETLARLFAARAGAAVSSARLYTEQAAITDTLMRELLPPRLQQTRGVEFAGGYRPAGDQDRVGGDFYDVHPATADQRETLAVLGDVCGKGLEAAVLTGKIRNTLHALLPLTGDHQRLLTLLNRALLTSHHTRFATLVLAAVRREGDRARVRVTSAGHPAPLVVRADGVVERVETRGSLIGVLPDVTSTTANLMLGPGESLVLFSDGITEARGGPLGGAEFGEDRLRAQLAGCAGMPAEAIVEHVQMIAAQWVGAGRHDDMAVVVISMPHGAHLSMVGGTGPGRYTA